MLNKYYDFEHDKFIGWVAKNQMVNSNGELFEWKEHLFLLDPLTDWHPNQGINKAAQLGFSESMILKIFYAAKHYRMNVLYTLPTDAFLNSFVPPKVDKIIENNPALRDIKGNVGLKSIGYGLNQKFVFFMGAHNAKSESKKEESSKGVSFSTDLNVHDEASRSDQFILGQMRSRFANSRYKGRWLFDNPTYPQMGADSVYQLSDQRHWFVTCEHCSYKQYLDWFRLDKHDFEPGTHHCWIDVERQAFLCGKCQKPLSDYTRRTGDWVAKFPNRTEYRGYWINQLCYIRHTVASIFREEEDKQTSKSHFYNYTLGKPYLDSDIAVTKTDIMKNLSGEVNKKLNNAMGVDQRSGQLHYVLGNSQGVFKIGIAKQWEEIEFLMNQYSAFTVMDGLPYQRDPKRIAEKYRSKAWRSFYKPESDQAVIAKFSPENDKTKVLIRREEAFDTLVDKIATGAFPIQIPELQLKEYIEHWGSMVRVTEQDSSGNMRFKWITTTGTDHFAHASLYFSVALLKTTGGKALVESYRRQGVPGRSSYEIIDGKVFAKDIVKNLV